MERINLKYWGGERVSNLMPENFVERDIGTRLLEAMENSKVVFLYGPRQSGKSSLVGWAIHKLLERGVPLQNMNYAVMDFLDLHPLISDTRKLIRLLREESTGKERVYLFIDEVQRLENAGLLLKQVADARMDIQIVATGSSIIRMKEKIQEHLTGRKIELTLCPFSFMEFLKARKGLPENRIRRYGIEEVGDFVDLYGQRVSSHWQEYIRIGGYPEAVTSGKAEEWLYSSLFSTYLERDVASLLSNANYQKFQDYVRVIASEIGSIYNRQSIARTMGRDARTIEKFEEILTITFILHKLTPFYTNIRKELSKAPRFYFWDTGFRNFISGELQDTFATGALLENAVVSEMLKRYTAGNPPLHWWRTKGGAEVDIVIIKGNRRIPIEIKGTRDKKPRLTRSFTSFIRNYEPECAYFATDGYYEESGYDRTRIYYIPSYMVGLLKQF
jgi:predicted AAA+ superfamily ATPase